MMPIQPNHQRTYGGSTTMASETTNNQANRVNTSSAMEGTNSNAHNAMVKPLEQFRCHSKQLAGSNGDDNGHLTTRYLTTLATEEDDNVSGISSGSSSSASSLDRAKADSRKISQTRNGNEGKKNKNQKAHSNTKETSEEKGTNKRNSNSNGTDKSAKRSKLDTNNIGTNSHTALPLSQSKQHLLSKKEQEESEKKEAIKRENNRRNAARSRSRNKVMVRELKKRVEELTILTQNLQRSNTILLSQINILRLSQHSQVAPTSSSSLFSSSLLALPSSQNQQNLIQQQNTNLFSSLEGTTPSTTDVPTATDVEKLGPTSDHTLTSLSKPQEQGFDQQQQQPIGKDVFDYINRQLEQTQQPMVHPFHHSMQQSKVLPFHMNPLGSNAFVNPNNASSLLPQRLLPPENSTALIHQLFGGFNRPPSNINASPPTNGGVLSGITNTTAATMLHNDSCNNLTQQQQPARTDTESSTTTTAAKSGQLVSDGGDVTAKDTNASILQQILDAMATISGGSTTTTSPPYLSNPMDTMTMQRLADTILMEKNDPSQHMSTNQNSTNTNVGPQHQPTSATNSNTNNLNNLIVNSHTHPQSTHPSQTTTTATAPHDLLSDNQRYPKVESNSNNNVPSSISTNDSNSTVHRDLVQQQLQLYQEQQQQQPDQQRMLQILLAAMSSSEDEVISMLHKRQ